ncbi:tetratricopeptide repeat protein [Microbulbifer sp. GL-2]|uniref:tetratricopeptide repeat protein n=1 Tax=Microbulbifer sp. GL-2 TaxID=2591606 RepID=UPI001162F3D7|nr:SEL1-like repeat protein [Microbulbifer sp. GL-2]BBM01743.1 hypothetical protein GL2_18170 [Microbulbifer sp. GL-2]
MNTLSLLYLNSKWERQDYAKASNWFERAAENKSMYGYFNQDRIYEEGLRVERSQAHALALDKESSSLGHATSSLKLAKVHSVKNASSSDLEVALYYLKKAAEQSENNNIQHTLEKCQKSQTCNNMELGKLLRFLSTKNQ